MKTKARNDAKQREYVRRYREKEKALGIIQVNVRIPAHNLQELRTITQAWRDEWRKS